MKFREMTSMPDFESGANAVSRFAGRVISSTGTDKEGR